MLLYIVRHGIAIDREDPKCPPEAERYLTEKGIAKTRAVAKAIAELGVEGDQFLSSPYVRAMQTAEIFAAALEYPKSKIAKTDALLPGAEALAFFRELARHSRSESVLCFGHAPHVDQLVAAALGTKKDITQMKKAGVAALELQRIAPPSATLLWLTTPKLLKNSAE